MRLVVLALSIVLAGPATAQLAPVEAIQLMGRGINLGNTLEPPLEGGWNNPPAEEYYFDDYVAQGFSSVRVPVRWDQHTQTSAPFAINEAWLDRVEQIVDWALERGLIVIINSHHDDWIKSGYENPALRDRFDAIWGQVSDRFEGKSDRLFFEIINEPFGMTSAQVNDLNTRILGIIREKHPTRLVIFSGHEWAGLDQLMAVDVPDDPWLLAYYHSYDPWDFAGLGNGTWGSPSDRQAMRTRYERAAEWSRQTGVPVMNSEFGALHEADFNSRMAYYATQTEEAVRAGVVPMAWDDGGMFGVYERANRSWPEVGDILIHAFPDGPTQLYAEVRDDTVAVVTWQNRELRASGLRVERRVLGGAFEPVAELGASSATFADSSVAGGVTYDYRVIALNGRGPDRWSYPFRITVPPFERSSFVGAPHPIPGRIEAEHYDVGGEGLTYHDTEPENIPGGFRPADGVDIEARDEGGWQVAYVEAGEWLEYTVNVAETAEYDLTVRVASLEGFGRFRVAFDQQASVILTAPATGSWQDAETVTRSVELEAGEQVMRVEILTARPFNLDWLELTMAASVAAETMPTRSDKLEVFPNPAADSIWLRNAAGGQVEIVDLLGRVVMRSQGSGAIIQMNTAGLTPGFYFARRAEQAEVSLFLIQR